LYIRLFGARIVERLSAFSLSTKFLIETTPGAAEEVVARTGKRAIPQFVIDGEWIQPYRPGEGFLDQEMSELLGVPEP